jgi:hypothetical protein
VPPRASGGLSSGRHWMRGHMTEACSGRSWVVSEPRCCCRPCSRSSTGNFDGATRRKVYALVGAAAAIARRSGRCWAGSSPRFLAAGLRARGCHHRRGPVRDPPRARCALRGGPGGRGGRAPLGRGYGRRRPRCAGVTRGWRARRGARVHRCGRAGGLGVVAEVGQAPGTFHFARSGAVPVGALPGRRLPATAPAGRPASSASLPRWRKTRKS